jgi:hypothetical protein
VHGHSKLHGRGVAYTADGGTLAGVLCGEEKEETKYERMSKKGGKANNK